MLTIPLEKLTYIIEKAREFDTEVPSDAEEGSNPADDEILLDTPDNPTTQELRDAIDGLNIDEREELLALVWLGRGDYNAEKWSEALQQARQTRTATETPISSAPRSSPTTSKRGFPPSASRPRISGGAEVALRDGLRPAARRFPPHAQEIFLSAFNNAWQTYDVCYPFCWKHGGTKH
jgi:Protein of unknown function (DUF3775)